MNNDVLPLPLFDIDPLNPNLYGSIENKKNSVVVLKQKLSFCVDFFRGLNAGAVCNLPKLNDQLVAMIESSPKSVLHICQSNSKQVTKAASLKNAAGIIKSLFPEAQKTLNSDLKNQNPFDTAINEIALAIKQFKDLKHFGLAEVYFKVILETLEKSTSLSFEPASASPPLTPAENSESTYFERPSIENRASYDNCAAPDYTDLRDSGDGTMRGFFHGSSQEELLSPNPSFTPLNPFDSYLPTASETAYCDYELPLIFSEEYASPASMQTASPFFSSLQDSAIGNIEFSSQEASEKEQHTGIKKKRPIDEVTNKVLSAKKCKDSTVSRDPPSSVNNSTSNPSSEEIDALPSPSKKKPVSEKKLLSHAISAFTLGIELLKRAASLLEQTTNRHVIISKVVNDNGDEQYNVKPHSEERVFQSDKQQYYFHYSQKYKNVLIITSNIIYNEINLENFSNEKTTEELSKFIRENFKYIRKKITYNTNQFRFLEAQNTFKGFIKTLKKIRKGKISYLELEQTPSINSASTSFATPALAKSPSKENELTLKNASSKEVLTDNKAVIAHCIAVLELAAKVLETAKPILDRVTNKFVVINNINEGFEIAYSKAKKFKAPDQQAHFNNSCKYRMALRSVFNSVLEKIHLDHKSKDNGNSLPSIIHLSLPKIRNVFKNNASLSKYDAIVCFFKNFAEHIKKAEKGEIELQQLKELWPDLTQ